MKKTIFKLAALAAVVAALAALAGCSEKAAENTPSAEPSKPAVASNPLPSFEPSGSDKLVSAILKQESESTMWYSTVMKLVRAFDPDKRNHDTVFYGASNFERWKTMEEDLAPYDVQNHAFGGSADQDLYHWAPYLLYPYEPQYVFFQTGSNDYVQSEAATDDLKVAEAMDFKKEMFAEFHAQLPDAKFVVMSGILLPGRAEYVDMTLEINDQLKAYCEETDYMIFIDAESLTYDREAGSFVEGVESLFVEDMIHLTEEARITWAQNWIIPMLEELEAPQTAG